MIEKRQAVPSIQVLTKPFMKSDINEHKKHMLRKKIQMIHM